MSDTLSIIAEWELLKRGVPEERATFAMIGVAFNDIWLSEADDSSIGRVRNKVPLSGYRLAEWFVWNWWRLRWEPRGISNDWKMSHRMASIGGGYVWPDITIISDGERIIVDAKPTEPNNSELLRYIRDFVAVVPAPVFERTIDLFLETVCERLVGEGIKESNLQLTWSDLKEERKDPGLCKRRRLEALLGFDVDDADEETIERLVSEEKEFGESAIQELAANSEAGSPPPTSAEIHDWARKGVAWKPQNGVRLSDRSEVALPNRVAAWKRGSAAARALRKQEGLGDSSIPNAKLCALIGASPNALDHTSSSPLSFALVDSDARVVLKTKHPLSRRFHLARLLGDRLATPSTGTLLPATDAVTYRQKVQRSFAAELLCPIEPLIDMLRGNFHEDAVIDAAEHFEVSTMAVRNILANNGLIEREDVLLTA